MRQGINQLLRESFIPVTLVIVLIFVLLLYVQYKSAIDANHITLIEIEHSSATLSLDGPLEEAGSELGKLISTNRVNDPLYVKAQALVTSGQLSAAEKLFREALAEKVTSETLNDLGVLYFKMGENRRALIQLDLAIKTPPVYASAYFNRGVVRAANGEYEKAIEDYQKMLTLISGHFEAQYNIGVTYLRLNKYLKATAAFDRASQLTGGSRKAKALYNKGIAFRALGGHTTQAEESLVAAVRIKPDYLDARIALVSLLPKDAENQQLALAELDKIINLKPSYSRAYFQKGLIYNDQKKTRKAMAAYRKAIQFNPEYSKAHYNLGLLLLASEQWADAQQQFEWILKRNPTHVRSIFNLGRAAYGNKDYPLSLQQYYNAVYIMEGNYPEAYLNIGLIHAAQKNYELASQGYKEAIRLRPDYHEAWYNQGVNFMRSERNDEAIASFKSALEHSPTYHQAWFNLGLIYTRMDQNDAAIEAYQNALKLRPDYQTARINLAIRYSQSARYEEAISLYKSVIESDSSYAKAWFNLGLAYTKTDNHSAAESTFRRLLALDPSDTRTLRLLSTALLKQQKIDEGIQLLKEAVDSEPGNARLHRELGRALRKGGYTKEAREEFSKSRRLTSKKTP